MEEFIQGFRKAAKRHRYKKRALVEKFRERMSKVIRRKLNKSRKIFQKHKPIVQERNQLGSSLKREQEEKRRERRREREICKNRDRKWKEKK